MRESADERVAVLVVVGFRHTARVCIFGTALSFGFAFSTALGLRCVLELAQTSLLKKQRVRARGREKPHSTHAHTHHSGKKHITLFLFLACRCSASLDCGEKEAGGVCNIYCPITLCASTGCAVALQRVPVFQRHVQHQTMEMVYVRAVSSTASYSRCLSGNFFAASRKAWLSPAPLISNKPQR